MPQCSDWANKDLWAGPTSRINNPTSCERAAANWAWLTGPSGCRAATPFRPDSFPAVVAQVTTTSSPLTFRLISTSTLQSLVPLKCSKSLTCSWSWRLLFSPPSTLNSASSPQLTFALFVLFVDCHSAPSRRRLIVTCRLVILQPFGAQPCLSRYSHNHVFNDCYPQH